MKLFPSLLLAAVSCAAVHQAQSAFVLIDDFESLSIGALNQAGSGWTSSNSAFTVAVDPADALNQVASFGSTTAQSNAFKSMLLPDGAVGTLFFRLRRSATWNMSVGASDLTPGLGGVFNDYESQLNFNRSDGNNYTRFNDASNAGGAFVNIDSDPAAGQQFDVLVNLWYNFWIVIDSSTNTSTAWVSADGALTPDFQLVGETSGLASFRFRNGTTNNNALINFLVMTSGTHTGPAYLDDIYFDSTGQNLNNPIPEPSSALALLGGAAMLLIRRRR
jgi:hypothetical protein